MAQLLGPSFGPRAGGPPRQLVVLLHGVGADGQDLIGLAPMLAHDLPHARFVAPDGPQPCDLAPYGRQWFSLQDRTPAAMQAGTVRTAPLVDGFIEAELARDGLADPQAALVGFSQGTMMALHVGLRRAKPLAGIVGFSGMLAGPEVLKAEIKSRPPVLLTHGDKDEMLPHILSHRAAEVLQQHDVKVGLHIAEGIGHGINDTGLSAAARFLIESFKLPMPQ